MSNDVRNNFVYDRKEGCIIHPDDLLLCDSSRWTDVYYLQVLQAYHNTVTDVRELYCSRHHLLKEIR